MKNIIRIIVSAVVILVLTAILVIGLSGEGLNMFNFSFKTFAYTYPDSNQYSKGNAEVSVEGIEKLDIDWITDSVKVETHSGNTISISEFDSEKLEEDEKLCYLVKDGVLHIRYWSPKKGLQFGWNFTKQKHLTVLIPESIAGSFTDCTVETESASMSIKDIASGKFKLDSTSGNIKLIAKGQSKTIIADSTSGNIEISATTENITCESTSGWINFTGEAQTLDCGSTSGDIKSDASVKKARFDTTSGNIRFSGKADEVRAESNSGDIVLNAKINKVNCDTNSGTTTFIGEVNEISCEATSGDISITSDVCPSKINADSTSGDIALKIPGDKGFTASYSTTSGDFSCDFAVKSSGSKAVYKDGSAQFNLSSTSGDIFVKEK
jgi:DUF4097 and DUF4098 domain-containing protein YvlB